MSTSPISRGHCFPNRDRARIGTVLGRLVASLLFVIAGCTDDEPDVPRPDPPPSSEAGPDFDPANTGSVAGRVVWDGPVPSVPPFVVFPVFDKPDPAGNHLVHKLNPFRPLIDPETQGLQDVVVCLRGIESRRAAPWPHAPVRVEHSKRLLRIVQGNAIRRVGFVRRGESIDAVNLDAEYHALRARGAAFFTLPLPEANRPTAKRLDETGIVELSSGAGFFWMHARLLVVEHPYYARTDSAGRFRIDNVPAGSYEAICWAPSWRIAGKDRDPETGLIFRVTFEPPVERSTPVVVEAGATTQVNFAGNG